MALMLTCSIILSIYTTAKDVWDTVQPLSKGIEQVRVNKMQYFVQQYEHFYFKTGESLNNVMSIFQKFLNALKLDNYKRKLFYPKLEGIRAYLFRVLNRELHGLDPYK